MGCAISSSPFISTIGNGILRKTKVTDSNTLYSPKEIIEDKNVHNEIECIEDTINVKKQNFDHDELDNRLYTNNTKNEIGLNKNIIEENLIKTSFDHPISSDFKIIPLKDPNDKIIEDALDELASTVDETTAEIKDEIKIENFIKIDKKQIIENENINQQQKNSSSSTTISDNTDMQSFDSLKTTSPEPEIEQAFANDLQSNPPTPKPTFLELEKIHNMESKSVINDLSHNDLREITENFTKNLSITTTKQGIGMKETIINSTKITNKKKNFPIYRPRSKRTSSNPTKWEKHHDRLSKGNKKLQRRKSSLSLFSDDSTMFKKPHTLYLVFGNNFLKTPKIKIIESQKGTRWMAKPKQTVSELDLYTGVKKEIGEIEIIPTTTTTTNAKKTNESEITKPRWNSSIKSPIPSLPTTTTQPKTINYLKPLYDRKFDNVNDEQVEELIQKENSNESHTQQASRFFNINENQINENKEIVLKSSSDKTPKNLISSNQNLYRNKIIPEISKNTSFRNVKSKTSLQLNYTKPQTTSINPSKKKINMTISKNSKTNKNIANYQIDKKLKLVSKSTNPNTTTNSMINSVKKKIYPRPIFNVVQNNRSRTNSLVDINVTVKNSQEIQKIDSENIIEKQPSIGPDEKFSKSMTVADIVYKAMKKNNSNETNSDKIRKEKAKLWLKSIQAMKPINNLSIENYENTGN